jgi:A/G-specific adenine glycosylase
MLQQTQVNRVVPRFESFVERFPGLEELAKASEDEVLAEWSGLGYYRRARMLHRLAREVVGRPEGLPRSSGELVKLPGIGPYTAAALASLAFGEVAPVLDGNVIRVGARVSAMALDPRSADGRRQLESWVRGLMDKRPAGEVNEALMELGATVCTPAEPDCHRCPFEPRCQARKSGRESEFPAPRRRRASESLRWAAACIVADDGTWLVRKVDRGPILRDLWLPPLVELGIEGEPLRHAASLVPFEPTAAPELGASVRHTITHRRIDVFPVFFEVASSKPPDDSWLWVDPNDPGVPTSSLFEKLVDAMPDRSNVETFKR